MKVKVFRLLSRFIFDTSLKITSIISPRHNTSQYLDLPPIYIRYTLLCLQFMLGREVASLRNTLSPWVWIIVNNCLPVYPSPKFGVSVSWVNTLAGCFYRGNSPQVVSLSLSKWPFAKSTNLTFQLVKVWFENELGIFSKIFRRIYIDLINSFLKVKPFRGWTFCNTLSLKVWEIPLNINK